MIPKVIHYCWFGGAPKSAFIKKCMQTWKEKMPDYQIKEWNETNFNFQEFPFIKSAYEQKKWAFVADYVRLYALYTEGGIYMDTDVKVMRGFDEFLKYDFFSANEVHPFFFEKQEQDKINPQTHQPKNPDEFINGFGVLSAIMGSKAGLPYLKDCINYYKSLNFNLKHFSINEYVIGKHITRLILKYGYQFIDENQLLKDNMMILESKYLVGNAIYLKKDSYAIHLCNGSWTDNSNTFNDKFRNNYPSIYPIYGFILRVINKLKRIFKLS